MLLLDMARPTRTRIPQARLVTVSLSRELVEAAAGSADRLHGRIIPARTGGLLADFLCSLTQRVAGLSPQAAPGVTRAMVELLRLGLGGAAQSSEPARVQIDRLRLAATRRFIVANLADPGLDPDAVAQAAAMSRATLYRVFEPLGGVSRYIQQRRLNRLRAAMLDPMETAPVSRLARTCGFASESHASRSFQKAYGARPAEFRDMTRSAASSDYGDGAAALKKRFASWQVEIR
jgi:AraC-like DNA-binding protein